jgi:hypothetical protein
MMNSKFNLIIVAAFLILLVVTACTPNRGVAPDAITVLEAPYALPRIWEDPETGCQYLIYAATGGMTARLDRDGVAMCPGASR